MQEIRCPKCNKAIKIYCKDGFQVNLDMTKANENAFCHNCKRRIAYSVEKQTKQPTQSRGFDYMSAKNTMLFLALFILQGENEWLVQRNF